MSERIENIVSEANEVVSKIYEQISQIDNCKAVLKNIGEAELSLLMPDGALAELKPALDDEQLREIKHTMESMISARIDRAAAFLESVSGAKAAEPTKPEPEPEAPASVPEKPAAPELEPVIPATVRHYVTRQSKMTVEDVMQMLKDGYSKEDIAKKYGYKTVVTVENFIKKNKIKEDVMTAGNDKAKQLTVKHIPEIRALYTNGPMNLTETAAELGTTKKILREFVEKNHLVKPVKY